MSESTPVNIQAFQPFEGGLGVQISVTGTTANAMLPGTQAVQNPDKLRILVTNDGETTVSIRMGQQGVQATVHCQRVMPGTQVLLTPPVVAPSGVWLAAISPSGDSTTIQATAGYGT